MPPYDFDRCATTSSSGELLGAIDIERGAKVSGARFYFLTGLGALLEFALVNLAMAQAVAAGLHPGDRAGAGASRRRWRAPASSARTRAEVYRVERDDLYLVGTSEVALAGMHADEVLDLSAGPQRYAGFSLLLPPRGRLVRQGHPRHHPGALVRQGRDVHLLPRRRRPRPSTCGCSAGRRSSSTALELPYRVVDIAAGDLGSSAARKFDMRGVVPVARAPTAS